MEAASDEPKKNILLMKQELQVEEEIEQEVQIVKVVQAQEAQEVVDLDLEEERRLTVLGQDPYYNHLLWQMNLTPEMVDDYYSNMLDEMTRSYESPYTQSQEKVAEEETIPNQPGTADQAAKEGKVQETGTQTNMEDVEAEKIKMALVEKKEQMKTIHQKLIAITEMMIQNQRAWEMEATTQETDQGDQRDPEVPHPSSKC